MLTPTLGLIFGFILGILVPASRLARLIHTPTASVLYKVLTLALLIGIALILDSCISYLYTRALIDGKVDIIRRFMSATIAGYLFCALITSLMTPPQQDDPKSDGQPRESASAPFGDVIRLAAISAIVVSLTLTSWLEASRIENMFARLNSVSFQGFNVVLTQEKLQATGRAASAGPAQILSFNANQTNTLNETNRNLSRITRLINSIEDDNKTIKFYMGNYSKIMPEDDISKLTYLLTEKFHSSNTKNALMIKNIGFEKLKNSTTCLIKNLMDERDYKINEYVIQNITLLIANTIHEKKIQFPQSIVNECTKNLNNELNDLINNNQGKAPAITEHNTKLRPYVSIAVASGLASIKRYGLAVNILSSWLANHTCEIRKAENSFAQDYITNKVGNIVEFANTVIDITPAEMKIHDANMIRTTKNSDAEYDCNNSVLGSSIENIPTWRIYRIVARSALASILDEWVNSGDAPSGMRDLLISTYHKNVDEIELLPGIIQSTKQATRKNTGQNIIDSIINQGIINHTSLTAASSCESEPLDYPPARMLLLQANQMQLIAYHVLTHSAFADKSNSATKELINLARAFITQNAMINKTCLLRAFQASSNEPQDIESAQKIAKDFLGQSIVASLAINAKFELFQLAQERDYIPTEELYRRQQEVRERAIRSLRLARHIVAPEASPTLSMIGKHLSDKELYNLSNLNLYYQGDSPGNDDIQRLNAIINALE